MRTKTPPPAEEEDPYDNDDWDMEDSPAKKNDEQAAKKGQEKDMWLENEKQDDFIDEIPSIPVQGTTTDAVSKPKETDFNKLVGGEK